MSRVAASIEKAQGQCEGVLFSLGVSRVLIDTQVVIRVEQAIKRDPLLRDLLYPVTEHMLSIEASIAAAVEYVSNDLDHHNQKGWS